MITPKLSRREEDGSSDRRLQRRDEKRSTMQREVTIRKRVSGLTRTGVQYLP